MQVFLANFASAPRWVFTISAHFIWSFADWAFRTRGLALDVLEATELAGRALTRLCVVAVKTKIAPKAHRISIGIGQCGGAEWALVTGHGPLCIA